MFSIQEQIYILSQFIENIATEENAHEKNIIDAAKDALNQLIQAGIEDRKSYVTKINIMVAELEKTRKGNRILADLKAQGFYHIVYHNPVLKGEKWEELQWLLSLGFKGVAVSAVFIAFFFLTGFFSLPAWLVVIATGLFAGAVTYLAGLTYGIINDLFATQMNLPYFLLGHQRGQTSLLQTNDPIAQSVGWGVFATVGPVLPTSILFAVIVMITAGCVTSTATFMLPLLLIAVPLIAVGAEFYARESAQDNSYICYGEPGSDAYQKNCMEVMSSTSAEKYAWYANSDRNGFGYKYLPRVALGALISLIVLSACGNMLPAVLVASTLFAVVCPVGFAAAAVLALTIAGIYLYVNREKMIDNRFKLDFSGEALKEDFYFEGELDTTSKVLLDTYKAKESNCFFKTSVKIQVPSTEISQGCSI